VVVVAAAVAVVVVAAVVAEALVELIRGERRESDMDAFVARFNYPLAQGNWAAVRLRKKSDKSEWIALFGSKSTPKLFLITQLDPQPPCLACTVVHCY
jgi:hypothetical protein